jgi:hypothetical protein
MSTVHDKLAARLRHVRTRVGVFIPGEDPRLAQAFLIGFRVAAVE